MKTGTAIMRAAEKHSTGAALAPCSRFFLPFACSPGTRSLWRDQPSSEQVQVRQRKSGKEPRGVLGQAPVGTLVKPHSLFTTWKACSPRARVAERRRLSRRSRELSGRWLGRRYAVTDTTLECPLVVGVAPVRLVAKDLALLPVQQLGHLADVGDVGRSGRQTVHDAALSRSPRAPSSQSASLCPSGSGASQDRAPARRSWSKGVLR